jgi:hypothetical protein
MTRKQAWVAKSIVTPAGEKLKKALNVSRCLNEPRSTLTTAVVKSKNRPNVSGCFRVAKFDVSPRGKSFGEAKSAFMPWGHIVGCGCLRQASRQLPP